jgi:hypothetical protein
LRHEHIDRGFRADNGYMPAADVEENYAKIGPRFFDLGLFNELQPFVEMDDQRVATTGGTIDRWAAPGIYFQAPRNAFGTVTWHHDESVRATEDSPQLRTDFLRFDATMSPTARWTRIHLFGDFGHLMDFDTGKVATGHALGMDFKIRPHDRVELITTLTHESRRTGEAATLLYYLSTASSWRLEWLHHADAQRSLDQSLALVFSHRPSWRQSLFIGASTTRRAQHDDWRLFLKWSRTV